MANLADAMLAAGFTLDHTRSAISNLIPVVGDVLAPDLHRLTAMQFGETFAVEVSFVADHEALKDGLQDNVQTHRVNVMAHTDQDAMLVAAQMVLARGVFVVGTELVL